MGAKTISHVQGKGSIAHNNRLFTPKNVDTSRTSNNVCYIQKPIAEAYSELFDKPVAEYNAKQKRSDRMIQDGYYMHLFNRSPCNTVVESANGQKSFYEDVVQIGTKNDTGVNSADADTAKLCLDEYMKGFQKRNPNFIVFNAVLHMDEATPHLHIDYIPIGHYSRGVSIQNGIAQALKEMGYGGGKDAINRWRQSERKALKEICISHGLEISDEAPGRGYSMKVEEYKEHQDKIHAYEEQEKALEAEIQPLLESKAVADSVYVSGVKMPLVNSRIVTENEFEVLNEQKKALAVQQNEIHELQNHFAKERLVVQTEKERLDEFRTSLQEQEKKLSKRNSELDSREAQVKKTEIAAATLYNTQVNLNEYYESIRNAYTKLDAEYREAKSYKADNEVLKERVDELKNQIFQQRSEYEDKLRRKDDDISAVDCELTECREQVKRCETEISGLKKMVDSLRSYIDSLFEVGRYMAKKLRMDFDDLVERRRDGYSLRHIFGDNSRER